ncbi:unnamed protein product [Vicia faba]|uniref:BHLH domain-containing protein n=1 Tax=Vicia faba TaxID=3906 RepID=A0AAV1AJB3_VICFA|nr:unnamed protein product [Vicia faba]
MENPSEMGNRKRARELGATTKPEEVLQVERERRKKMSQMFTHLATTVPALHPTATKEMIINETIAYIKELESKKKMLEEIKESNEFPVVEGSFNLLVPCRNRNCSVSVTVSSNNVAFFGIESVAKRGLVTVIFEVFFKNQMEILGANVSVNDGNLRLAITALVQNNGRIEKIKTEIMGL